VVSINYSGDFETISVAVVFFVWHTKISNGYHKQRGVFIYFKMSTSFFFGGRAKRSRAAVLGGASSHKPAVDAVAVDFTRNVRLFVESKTLY